MDKPDPNMQDIEDIISNKCVEHVSLKIRTGMLIT